MTTEQMVWIRKQLGLDQSEMARRLGLGNNEQVSRIERGHRQPSGPTKAMYKMLEREALMRERRKKKRREKAGVAD